MDVESLSSGMLHLSHRCTTRSKQIFKCWN